jgi:hypothetical protein
MQPSDLSIAQYWRHILFRHHLLSHEQAAGLCVALLTIRHLLCKTDIKELEYTLTHGNLAWHMKITVQPISLEEHGLTLPSLLVLDAGIEDVIRQFLLGVERFSATETMQELTNLFFDTIPFSWRDHHQLSLSGLHLSWVCENLTMSENIATILSSLKPNS